MTAARIRIFGRVQGVNFRNFAKSEAKKLGICGCAKNNTDGSIEIWAEGEEGKVKELLNRLLAGPILAKVERLEYQAENQTMGFKNFEIIRSGSLVKDQISSLSHLLVPKHVVIIPDGNRRWAKERGMPVTEGHRIGSERFKELARVARDLGIKTVTIWGFSTENWGRSKREVDYLFGLFKKIFKMLEKEVIKNKVRFRHLGRRDRLPAKIVKALMILEEKTKKFSRYNLNLALDYGGRDEILRGIERLLKKKGKLGKLDDKSFSQLLDSKGLDDPDFIIRTSGEQRLSGMFAWQGAYAELFFSPLYFPDFGEKAFREAITEFGRRQRRFGK